MRVDVLTESSCGDGETTEKFEPYLALLTAEFQQKNNNHQAMPALFRRPKNLTRGSLNVGYSITQKLFIPER